MTTDIRALLRRQLDLEDESRALGVSRYNSRELPWKVEVGTPDEEANLPPGRKLLKAGVIPVAEAIEAFLAGVCSGKAGRRHAAADPLLLADPMEAAYLTMRVLVNASRTGATLQSTAVAVADALMENIQFQTFRTVNRAGYKGLLAKQDRGGYSRQRKSAIGKLLTSEGAAKPFSDDKKVLIGSLLIELAVEATGFFIVEKTPRSRGFAYTLRASETLRGWLDIQHAQCALMNPISMPMLVRPRRWKSPFYGGYLSKRPGIKFIKQRNRAYHDEVRNIDLTRVFGAVNHIQDTPWRINTAVLDVLNTVWSSGGRLGGLPPTEDEPLPARPDDIETNEEAKTAWKRAAAEVYRDNGSLMGARLALHQKLWTARRFAPEAAIYFPHELDFRGRVYPQGTSGPSPQGDDVAKALIHFADGKPLGASGKKWLMVHIANLFGVDKVPFEERVAWVYDNAEAIINSGIDPLDGDRFWTTADSPYMALAACFEFVGMLEEGEAYVSRLPIALDGSNSGLQHFSAMLRDPDGARAVNLLPSERPQDVYREVMAKAQAIADTTATIVVGPKDAEETVANPWRGGKITRDLCKRPTMTFCYSSTRFGMQGMILQKLREMDRDLERKGLAPYLDGSDNYGAAMWLSHVLFASISETVAAAAVAMEWLRAAASVASQAKLPIWWTTPMGLPILQEYKTQKGKVVRAHWGGRAVDLVVLVDTEALDSRAQMNGVAPNFIHSLDAAHLMAVAERAREKGIGHIAVIHDSFGTHACNTEALSDILRETFVEQYTPDILRGFYDELVDQLPEDIAVLVPTPPAMGTFDLEQVRKSQFVFA
jgi:DNA-directed RNA polymerase